MSFGDDEIGISISLHHLRNLLVARLVQAGIILSNTHVLSCEPADQSMVVRFADSSLVAFDWVINTTPNQKSFSQVPWQQSGSMEVNRYTSIALGAGVV